jgi:hypothetical protein
MILKTKLPIQKEVYNPINYNSKILLLGSCFSENIGNKLSYYKFQTNQNPFGIIFHPKAIETFITNAINEKEYLSEDVFLLNERWHCFEAHSNVCSSTKEELILKLNTKIKFTKNQLENASHIIITLGTSWVYRFIETDAIVANCHKVPQKKFLKEILSVDEIIESIEGTIAMLKSINPKITVVLTISPIRHLKDGFVQNQQSKSHLATAIHQIIDPRNKIHYFPSYEIMMDELRDYRFYAEDMIHPTQTAIHYIWEKFIETWLSEDTKLTMQEVESIQKGTLHKPFNEQSEQHQEFLKKLADKKHTLQNQFSWMHF